MSRLQLDLKEDNMALIFIQGNRFYQTAPVGHSLSVLTFSLVSRGLLVTFVGYVCLAAYYTTLQAKGCLH